MNGTAVEELEDLRKSLQHAICKIIFAEDRQHGTRTSQSALSALSELTFHYAVKSFIPDLYTFSNHANRKSTIAPDDVAIVLRKLPSDQLAGFKENFCNGKSAGKNPSILQSTNTSNRKLDSRTKATANGRRRKRNKIDVGLSSSSSSFSDDEMYENAKNRGSRSKQEAVFDMLNKNRKRNSLIKSGASNAPSARRSSTNASSLCNDKIKGIDRTGQRESVSSKFKLSERNPNESIGSDDLLTDDDDILRESSRLGMTEPLGNAQSMSKLFMQRTKKNVHQRQCKKRINSGHRNPFLDDDDGDDTTTDEDDIFQNKNNNNKVDGKKETKPTSCHNNPIALDNDDDDASNIDGGNLAIHHGNEMKDESDKLNREMPKQSQVAEALANLSSDSGMEENNSDGEEDENVRTLKSRHHPTIESEDDG